MKYCPKISFVIPIYNRAHLILKTLESLKQQTIKDWEAIIVDDNSTDDIETVIKDFDPRVVYVKLPNNLGKGVSCARNYGNMIAKAELIAVLDSDDLAKPERVEYALKSYAENKWDFYSTHRENYFELENKTMLQKVLLENWDDDQFKIESYVGHSTVVYTKKAALEIPYNSALTALDDYDLISRFMVLGKKMYLNPVVTGTNRIHTGERISTKIDRLKQEEIKKTIRIQRGWEASQ